ncbi:MAG: GerMN domain-containing protein [Candidatus Gastranaerophilaceae bacterium]|jgi:alr5055 protein|uniref:GerMN domain-containing protein n=1 Tax=Candidatus Limenecus avicola TaxID=2840847 RepID=A0A9D1N191_9CLOT|nr:GerMN domain-containing protein [Clostridium sp.]CDC18791.1 putative uncharacterized protein [Clostridium sp. CAG:306]HIU92806.1 GerMN domain-containing protein [Candidatus Limenecus avicola]
MGFWSKLVILALAALAFFYVKVNFFDTPHAKVEKKLVVEEQVAEPVKKVEPTENKKQEEEKKVTKTYVTVYFLGMDKNDTGIFKKVKREVPQGQSKLKFALNQLMNGPSQYEKSVGVYSEIPKNVKILGIVESSNKIIIDVSGNIQTGGGADSIYSRMKQFIKTALANSPKKPIYLYIDGKQAEVLGGEGIMISQPLSENSLDG